MFKTLEEYGKYLQRLSLKQLVDISKNINRDAHPERFDLVREYIARKRSEEEARRKIEKAAADANATALKDGYGAKLKTIDKFKKIYLHWKGRISRLTYWVYSIPLVLIFIISEVFISPANENLSLVITFLIAYPGMMINIKRAHDRGRSGFFALLLGVPIIGLWPLIEFGFIAGTEGNNSYGEPDNFWS